MEREHGRTRTAIAVIPPTSREASWARRPDRFGWPGAEIVPELR
jgi:hypothetical protein